MRECAYTVYPGFQNMAALQHCVNNSVELAFSTCGSGPCMRGRSFTVRVFLLYSVRCEAELRPSVTSVRY